MSLVQFACLRCWLSPWQWSVLKKDSLKGFEPDKSQHRSCSFRNHQRLCAFVTFCVRACLLFLPFLIFASLLLFGRFLVFSCLPIQWGDSGETNSGRDAFPVKLSLCRVMLRQSTIRRENDKNKRMVSRGRQSDMLNFKQQYCCQRGQNNMSAIQAM